MINSIRDLLRGARFSMRNKIRWRRGLPVLKNEEKAELFDYLAVEEQKSALAEEVELRQRYSLGTLYEASSLVDYRDNIYLLSALSKIETYLSFSGNKIRALDIGSKNWNYVYSLCQYLRFAGEAEGRELDLCGVEIDAYGIYSDLYSRHDYAQAYVKQAQVETDKIEYVVGDFLEKSYRDLDVVTLFFPFVLEEALTSWGLPKRHFEPHKLLQNALDALKANRFMVVTNQTGSEARQLNAYLNDLPGELIFQEPLPLKLVHYWAQTSERVLSLIKKDG